MDRRDFLKAGVALTAAPSFAFSEMHQCHVVSATVSFEKSYLKDGRVEILMGAMNLLLQDTFLQRREPRHSFPPSPRTRGYRQKTRHITHKNPPLVENSRMSGFFEPCHADA